MSDKFVGYYRVSTAKQGSNGLGMAAQKHTIQNFLRQAGGTLVAEFSEVETGKRNNREELAQAIALCRKTKARLIIAKLDRLARNAAFLLSLRDSGIDFVCCDMPHADRFTVGILALVAEREAELISERTKAGLAAARRRGTRIGNPHAGAALKLARQARTSQANAFAEALRPIVAGIRKAGMTSLRQIAFCLNARGYKTPQGKEFRPQSVKQLIERI